MDNIFRSDEQEFISRPVDFRCFMEDAIIARSYTHRLANPGSPCNEDTVELSKRVANITGTPLQLMQKLVENIYVNSPQNPLVRYNFEIDDGCDGNILPNSRLRTLQILKMENEKRLNPQYKSISLRAMKYDHIEVSLLCKSNRRIRKSQISEDFDVLSQPRISRNTRIDCGRGLKRKAEVSENPNSVILGANSLLPTTDSSEGLGFPNQCSSPEVYANSIFQEDDIIASVSIFIGYSRPLENHELRLGRLMKVTDRVWLLGRNTLVDLKNSFECPSDYAFLDDLSCREPTMNDICKSRYPSSFFFIHDTFYVDLLPEGSEDISLGIRKWARKRPEIGELKFAHMQNTNVLDLTARLGAPYLYVHQGTCEHLICFNDIRLRNASDPLGPYPVRLLERNFRRIACAGCKMNTAEWSVMQSDVMPTTPQFMCSECYNEFNFTQEGHKWGSFIAVPYCDRKATDESGIFLKKLRKTILKGRNNGE